MNAFGAELRRLRKARQLSQMVLADLALVAAPTVSLFESGARKPQLETVRRVAEALDVDSNVLVALALYDRAYDEGLTKAEQRAFRMLMEKVA